MYLTGARPSRYATDAAGRSIPSGFERLPRRKFTLSKLKRGPRPIHFVVELTVYFIANKVYVFYV